jgi:hypothetical protein
MLGLGVVAGLLIWTIIVLSEDNDNDNSGGTQAFYNRISNASFKRSEYPESATDEDIIEKGFL